MRRAAICFAILFVVAAGSATIGYRQALRRHRPAPPPEYPTGFRMSANTDLSASLAAETPKDPWPNDPTPERVRAWQARVTARLAAILSHPAPPSEVSMETDHETTEDDVRRTCLTFEGAGGVRIPAFLFEPVSAGPRPGLLVIPGHGGGIAATGGLVEDDYQHAAARALARKGYTTLTPELRGFGLLTDSPESEHRVIAHNAIALGSTYKATLLGDLRRALSVLAARPGVDRDRIGAVGTSFGGEMAVLTAILDERVKAVVCQGWGLSTGPKTVYRDAHGCHLIPGINRILFREDWLRLLAPRPVLVVRGTEDSPKDLARGREAVTAAWSVLGARERFSVEVEDGGHEFFLEPAVRFLSVAFP